MAAPQPEKSKRWIPILGIAMLVGGYILSVVNISRTNEEQYDPGVKTVRMVHWHLEMGIRDHLQDVINDYEALKASQGEKVRIVQIPISEKGYVQFVRTNMIGGTLPDMVEWGRLHNPADILRYFTPLTEEVSQSNPYNKGTDLEGVPWRETFFDNLRFAFVRELQDYYSVGFSTFTIRLFYNKDLLKEITGSDVPPTSYEDFIKVCDQIETYAVKNHEVLHPISSSAYAVTIFENNLQPALIGDLAYGLDYSLDGNLTIQEKIYGFVHGDYDFTKDLEVRYAHEIVQRLTKYFAPGFMAVQRDESVRQFVQGQAVFYTSGSWDIPSLQFNTPFKLGVAEFPLPDASHQKYGPYFDGPPTEAETATGFSFGIAKNSRHPDLAIDFLRYATSRGVNEEFNRKMRWIPSIRDAKVDDFIGKFLPNTEGSVNPYLFSLLGSSGRVFMLKEQLYWPYVSGNSTYDQYAEALEKEYIPAAAHDLKIQDENNRRGAMETDRTRWVFLLRAMAQTDPKQAAYDERRFRIATEGMNHSLKDTMINRKKFNELIRDDKNPKVEQFREAMGLKEGEAYVP